MLFIRLNIYLLTMVGSISIGFSQIKPIKLDGGEEGRAPSEPTVAINPTNPNNIVAGAILDKVYTTFDGGKTWETSRLESSYGVWGDPVLVADHDGNFFYFHLSDPTGNNWQSEEILDRIVVQKSEDGGKTWDDGNYFGMNHPKDQDKEWAVFDLFTENLYATWTQFDKYGSSDSEHKSNILFSSSHKGKKWSKPVQINKVSGDCVDGDQTTEGAVPAVGMSGQIFVTWAHDEKIYFDRSFDKGKTWLTNDLVIAEQSGGWDMDIPGINRCNGMPVLVSDRSLYGNRGLIYMVWADQRSGTDDTDIWFIKSSSNGDRWTQPIKINSDGPGKHQFFPWMTIDPVSGNIYIVFYDRRNHEGLETDVFMAYSTDGGDSFANIKISETPFIPSKDVFFGDYTNIAAYNGIVVPIWTRMDNGQTSIMTAIINDQELGVEPRRLPIDEKKQKKQEKLERKKAKKEGGD